MKPLEHPNSFYLIAAEGWLEPGDHLEANEELERISANWLIAYNLACYQTQLGDLEEAWRWLGYAMDKADTKEIKLKALDDPDLEPLWRRIGELRDQ